MLDGIQHKIGYGNEVKNKSSQLKHKDKDDEIKRK